MDTNLDSLTIEKDYYAFLNVSKTATAEEISNAYRKLSLMYHPDKHNDPEKKKWAESIFNKTKQAHEVLSDPHQRAIYDTLGMKGLETEGWEIVQRTKTPLEIREEYERLAREREEQRLLRSTNPKGTTTVAINATDLFSEYVDEFYDVNDNVNMSRFPIIEVSGINSSHSVEAPLTPTDTVVLSCNLSTQNGTGTGTMNIAARKITSEKGWAELDLGIGNGPTTGLKVFRTITKRVFFTGVGMLQFSPHGIHPSLVSNMAVQLNSHAVGYLTYKAGANSSMTTTMIHDSERFHCNLSIQFGVPHSFVSVAYTRKMLDGELKLRLCFKIGTFGGLAEYGVEKKLSQHTNISGAVTIGVPSGVTLKIKITRGSQTFVFPIHLCEEALLAPIFYATVVPMVSWLAIKKLIIDPINNEKTKREKERTRDQNKSKIQEMQKEAKWATDLMQETYNRIKTEEAKQKGLIIIYAYYGKLPTGLEHHEEDNSQNSDILSSQVLDVTVQIQCLVKNSKLILQPSSKSQLPGFFDICLGDEKHLTISYSFHDQTYKCTIKDDENLTIPI